MARVARRLVQVGVEEGVVTRNTSLGVTGRAGISGNKPLLILEEIENLGSTSKWRRTWSSWTMAWPEARL